MRFNFPPSLLFIFLTHPVSVCLSYNLHFELFFPLHLCAGHNKCRAYKCKTLFTQQKFYLPQHVCTDLKFCLLVSHKLNQGYKCYDNLIIY